MHPARAEPATSLIAISSSILICAIRIDLYSAICMHFVRVLADSAACSHSPLACMHARMPRAAPASGVDLRLLCDSQMADTAEVSLAKRLRDEERAYTVRVRQPNGKTSGRMHAYVSVECLPWTSRISFASNFVLF
eukprot:COSAG02_NODE_6972_length_3256_cov_1.597403_2_plen_136_part_00